MGQLSESLLRNNPLVERFAREGRKEGTLTALHHSLLLVLQGRGLRVTEAQRARIEATDDQATLDAWMSAAVTAATTGEVLRHRPAVPKATRKGR